MICQTDLVSCLCLQGPITLADLIAQPKWKLGLRALTEALFGIVPFTMGKMSCHSDEMFIMFNPR